MCVCIYIHIVYAYIMCTHTYIYIYIIYIYIYIYSECVYVGLCPLNGPFNRFALMELMCGQNKVPQLKVPICGGVFVLAI